MGACRVRSGSLERAPERIAIRAARLFDGHGPGYLLDPLVLVEGGRVVEAGSCLEPPPGVEVVDLGGLTLLPGLVDSHVHLALNATDEAVDHVTHADEAALLASMRAAAARTLAAGVTTVRDLGDRDYLSLRLREETAADPTAGPAILASGPPLTTPGGHCWFLGGEASGVDGVRAAVRERAERGADVVKVMATGGGITAGSAMHERQYGRAELRAAAEEAHRLGLPITAHAHSPEGIADVVAVGFDGIEHCTFYAEDGVRADEGLVRELAERGIAVSLTLGALPGGPPLTPEQARQLPAFVAGLRMMRDAGVTLVCGSDSGIFAVKPHGGLAHSVAAMVDMAGLTPLDALRSATSVAARACGVGERKGMVAAGFDADLIGVEGDPLADPAALLDARAVFRAGRPVARDEQDALGRG